MNKKALWIGIPIVIFGVVGASLALKGKGERLLDVQTAQVTREKIVQTVNATGRIQPRTQVKISGDVSAKITKLAVEEGQWVEAGAFLVELDRERYLAAVESAEANVRAAQANANLVRESLNRLEKEYHRSRELMSRNVETQAAFDAAESAYLGREGPSGVGGRPGRAGQGHAEAGAGRSLQDHHLRTDVRHDQ